MSYSVGQRVLFLHEPGGGVVVDIPNNHSVQVECEDGFKRTYRLNEITSVKGEYDLSDEMIIQKDQENTEETTVRKSIKGIPVIDLHIHELTEEGFDESNGRALERQMKVLRKFIEDAMNKKVRDLIIIHGVGSGILRSEVRNYLNGISGAEFFDADYTEFGVGATRVILRYSY